jgi:hypothetical protein
MKEANDGAKTLPWPYLLCEPAQQRAVFLFKVRSRRRRRELVGPAAHRTSPGPTGPAEVEPPGLPAGRFSLAPPVRDVAALKLLGYKKCGRNGIIKLTTRPV